MSKKLFSIENIFISLLSISFFIGIWHAFPMLNVVNDEMYYVGGVLRALEHHTIIPLANDVPYGTLTYLSNYGATLVTLAMLFPFFKFHFSELKSFLIQSPEIMYLSLRLLSAVFSILILYLINGILKKEFENIKVRIFLLILLFTNIITVLILHTGKMWVLSVLLVIASIYFLHKSVVEDTENVHSVKKNALFAIIFSFLAFSNFAFFAFSLINIPLLVYFFRKEKDVLKSIFWYSLIGFILFLAITLFNFISIKDQIISIFTEYHPLKYGVVSKLGFFKSLFSYTQKLLFLFPITIVTLIAVLKDGVKNRKLLIISISYFIVYFLGIVLVANWTGDIKTYLRYLFPLSFFLVLIISSFNIKFNKLFYVIGIISVVYFILTLYLLSVPTTYNKAYVWVNDNLTNNRVLIVNDVPELQLIKNKKSAILVKTPSCATKCQNIIKSDLNSNYNFTVVDRDSIAPTSLSVYSDVYYIFDNKQSSPGFILVTSFTNNSETFHSVDYNMGSYFDLSLFKIHNLGKDIYIYKKI